MRPDVETLRRFYQSPLGQAAAEQINRATLSLWPDVQGREVLGFGYTPPYLRPYLGQAGRMISAMPAVQGVEYWPDTGKNAAVLCEEDAWPFADGQFDRVLLAHALEDSPNIRTSLREVWRVLAPEGRVLVVMTARQGVWSAGEHTPFGHGRPYSRRQLCAELEEALFESTSYARALYLPPLAGLARYADLFERVGRRLYPRFSGVIVVEAVKRLYAPTGLVRTSSPARPRPVSLPAGYSGSQPVTKSLRNE